MSLRLPDLQARVPLPWGTGWEGSSSRARLQHWGTENSIRAPLSPGFQVPFDEVPRMVLVQTEPWVGFVWHLFESSFHHSTG